MQINITTDYAIRTCLYLYLQGEEAVVTFQSISDQMGIPVNYMSKIIKSLRNAGLISVQRGQYGGCQLAGKKENISLYDIMQIMEPEKINRCLEKDHFCSRDAYDNCPVCCFYSVIQEKWDACLKEMTLKTLASSNIDKRSVEETLRHIAS